MKLRNKKTGEIKSIEEIIRDAFLSNELNSLKSIDTNWEDVDDTNDTNTPLIKDEKIRKVVRAWAKINTFEPGYSVMYDAGIFGLTSYQADIEFNFPLKELKGGKYYTIEELCGEEEE